MVAAEIPLPHSVSGAPISNVPFAQLATLPRQSGRERRAHWLPGASLATVAYLALPPKTRTINTLGLLVCRTPHLNMQCVQHPVVPTFTILVSVATASYSPWSTQGNTQSKHMGFCQEPRNESMSQNFDLAQSTTTQSFRKSQIAIQ